MLEDSSLTINEFCKAERLARAMLYRLWAEGKGPRWFNVGTKRLISHEARTEWRRRLEAEAAKDDGLPSIMGGANVSV
jgi:hypothetical protein